MSPSTSLLPSLGKIMCLKHKSHRIIRLTYKESWSSSLELLLPRVDHYVPWGAQFAGQDNSNPFHWHYVCITSLTIKYHSYSVTFRFLARISQESGSNRCCLHSEHIEEGVIAKVVPQCSFCLILFQPHSDRSLMPCVWQWIPSLQLGAGQEFGSVKTSKPPGAHCLHHADIHLQIRSQGHDSGPILKTFLTYCFLTDYHSIFQMIKQENL